MFVVCFVGASGAHLARERDEKSRRKRVSTGTHLRKTVTRTGIAERKTIVALGFVTAVSGPTRVAVVTIWEAARMTKNRDGRKQIRATGRTLIAFVVGRFSIFDRRVVGRVSGGRLRSFNTRRGDVRVTTRPIGGRDERLRKRPPGVRSVRILYRNKTDAE